MKLEILGQSLEIQLPVGLCHAGRHAVIKVGNTLAAVHFVLVGLNGDTGQCGIAADVIGLPQVAVTGGETAVEQLQQVDLTAGFGQSVKILVVNMDIAVEVCLCNLFRNHIFVIEGLCTFGAVFQHGAHGGVCVDVGVLPLQVHVCAGPEGQMLVNLHQVGVHFPHLLMLGAIQDVGFGGFGKVKLNELLLNGILHLFHRGGNACFIVNRHHQQGDFVQLFVGDLLPYNMGIRLENSSADLIGIKGNLCPVAFDNGFYMSGLLNQFRQPPSVVSPFSKKGAAGFRCLRPGRRRIF